MTEGSSLKDSQFGNLFYLRTYVITHMQYPGNMETEHEDREHGGAYFHSPLSDDRYDVLFVCCMHTRSVGGCGLSSCGS
jgi:hypothetical protein